MGQLGRLAFDGQDLGALLSDIGDGDTSAFEELYRRTSARLFGICLHVLPDRFEAEEVLQESYIAVWRRAASFNHDRGQPMTWLMAIARNQAIDRLRATKPVANAPIEFAAMLVDDRLGAADSLIADEEHSKLVECLGELASADRRLIHTAYFEGSSYRELAERSATPLGTIKTRIRRVLSQLRTCLQ